MDDTVLEIENISNCGDDLETDEPLVESMAADRNNAAIQETSAQPIQSQQTSTSVVPVNDHMLVSTATQSGVRSTSSGSTTEATLTSADSPRGTVTEPAVNDGTRTTVSARIQPRIQQSHTQLENRDRDGEVQNNQEDHIRRQDRLIEEPPPLYSNLFSASYVHNATNNCDSRRIPLQANCSEHHNHLPPSTVPRHSLCQDPSCLHHCSSFYCPPFPHSSQHHTSLLLPGEIGQHPAHYHTLQQTAPHHITVLPMHSEPDQVGAEDYLKLSFICLVLCSFHLNLPALFCVLPALAYSIKAQNLNVERRYRQARKYSRAALTCNLIASCQYIIVVLVFVIIALYVL